MSVGVLYFKYFGFHTIRGDDRLDLIVSLADFSKTKKLIEYLLAHGVDYGINYGILEPVFFQWGRNQLN